MEEKYLKDLHRDHQNWITELSFSADELESFKLRLEEVVQANTNKEVLAMAEHFQNQFIRQKEMIDILKHRVNEAEHGIVQNAINNNVATDHRKAPAELELSGEIQMFNKIFSELKVEYQRYLSEVL
jgi:hypothetical protein